MTKDIEAPPLPGLAYHLRQHSVMVAHHITREETLERAMTLNGMRQHTGRMHLEVMRTALRNRLPYPALPHHAVP
ncbi:hypothetical protein QF037_009822 [Streptomyces canus]|nr:hypothetical protein [Streptomyces canus]